MKNILLLLTMTFSISSFAQMSIAPSSSNHKATECPILDGLYVEDWYGNITYNIYRTKITPDGAIYSAYRSDESGKFSPEQYETIYADGKMKYRNAPYDNSKAWTHVCINEKTLVVDFLNENENFKVYSKRTIVQNDLNTFSIRQDSLDEAGTLQVMTGSITKLKKNPFTYPF